MVHGPQVLLAPHTGAVAREQSLPPDRHVTHDPACGPVLSQCFPEKFARQAASPGAPLHTPHVPVIASHSGAEALAQSAEALFERQATQRPARLEERSQCVCACPVQPVSPAKAPSLQATQKLLRQLGAVGLAQSALVEHSGSTH
jgi:hypothetical protein